MPNRLWAATSPYLLQHADNPVDWYPWGDEAFEEARRRDGTVLVSSVVPDQRGAVCAHRPRRRAVLGNEEISVRDPLTSTGSSRRRRSLSDTEPGAIRILALTGPATDVIVPGSGWSRLVQPVSQEPVSEGRGGWLRRRFGTRPR